MVMSKSAQNRAEDWPVNAVHLQYLQNVGEESDGSISAMLKNYHIGLGDFNYKMVPQLDPT